MTLLAILISLAVSRLAESVKGLRQMDWFETYVDWVRTRISSGSVWDGPLGVFVVIAPIVFILGWAYVALSSLFGLFGFAFAIVVLVACIGPRDIDKLVQKYVDAWDYDDTDAINRYAAELGGKPGKPGSDKNMSILETVLVGTHEQLLGVVFWFAVLGPVGAVLYRLSATLEIIAGKELREWRGFYEAAEVLHGVLDWVPARLTTLGYAITGSFVDALHKWRDKSPEWREDWIEGNRSVLIAGGTGALQLDSALDALQDDEMDSVFWLDQVRAVQALARRTVVLWLTAIAIMTLAGWAG